MTAAEHVYETVATVNHSRRRAGQSALPWPDGAEDVRQHPRGRDVVAYLGLDLQPGYFYFVRGTEVLRRRSGTGEPAVTREWSARAAAEIAEDLMAQARPWSWIGLRVRLRRWMAGSEVVARLPGPPPPGSVLRVDLHGDVVRVAFGKPAGEPARR